MDTTTKLQRTIMRRVYYSFLLSVVLHPAFVAGLVFITSMFAVKSLVHVARVWQYFVSVPVGQLPEFVYNVVTHSEAPTLLATAAMCISFGLLVRLLFRQPAPTVGHYHVPV